MRRFSTVIQSPNWNRAFSINRELPTTSRGLVERNQRKIQLRLTAGELLLEHKQVALHAHKIVVTGETCVVLQKGQSHAFGRRGGCPAQRGQLLVLVAVGHRGALNLSQSLEHHLPVIQQALFGQIFLQLDITAYPASIVEVPADGERDTPHLAVAAEQIVNRSRLQADSGTLRPG